ncbi:MAG: histidine phosphatase family protein [Bacteroidetes bacterium]|nr:histidine phosphatase family protein [Bacteroidota bacterium]
MKTLIVIRHAKSSWDSADISDFDRPLNDRGRRDAPAMAARLIKAGVSIDRFVSSPAKRARQTAEHFIHAFDRKEKEIQFIEELYHASLETFRDVVAALDDKDDTVAIFSHNPGITAFVNVLTSVRIDNMPTCAVFAAKSPAEHWTEFQSAGPQFWFLDYPKLGS